MSTSIEHSAPASQDPSLLDRTLASPEQEASITLRELLGNEELIYVAEQYVRDEEGTDIQRLLLDPDSRPKVIGELGKISEVANWSIAESLLDSSDGHIDGMNLISGSQSAVDVMSEQLRTHGSPLFTESKYPKPESSEYWQKESDFIATRKQSGDARWLAVDDLESADSLRLEAEGLQESVQILLESTITSADVEDSVVGISQRVKGIKSLVGKIEKFRQTEWGKDATVADAVDLIGGRIVVEDLTSLEKVMLSLEAMEESGNIVVLRKENKFIANDGKPDPYRAIHYVIELPGTMHTVEIQIKTLSSMIASDLYHNAVYKPHILKLPGELQDSVSAYNWRSVESEMEEYSTTRGVENTGQDLEIRTEKQNVEHAIETMDYNVFYELVLSKIKPSEPIAGKTKELIGRFHAKETEKLMTLMEQDEPLVLALAGAAHNAYFEKAVVDMVNDPTKPQLGHEISDEALSLLPDTARERYLARFDNFNGSNNKLTAFDLELDKLDETSLTEFFKLMGKDFSSGKGKLVDMMNLLERHKAGDDQSEQLKKIALINMFHASFDELMIAPKNSSGERYDPESQQAQLWRDTLVSSQIKAIATSSLLTEIGGYDQNGDFRDITKKVFVGSDYSMRELLTFAVFISADRTSSEFSDSSYESFVNDESSEWARDFDKVIDTAIMNEVMEKQMNTINSIIEETQSNVQLARLQKARLELIAKQLRAIGRHADAEALQLTTKTEVVGLLERQEPVTSSEVNQRFSAIVGGLSS